MARANKSKAKSTSRSKSTPRKLGPARAPGPSFEQQMMEDAALEMLEILSCPVLVAEDHAERAAEASFEAEEDRDLAQIAARLHPDSAVAAVLAEVAELRDRHARELAALVDRLHPLTDHEAPHDHVEPDDDAMRDMMVAMFGAPHEGHPG
jgi:hypothetical protein